MRAWIISIGTELSLGQTVDTNSAWLAAELAARGIRAARHVTVADELTDLVTVLNEAAARAHLILITGGLGPTEDDLTREALARTAGVELVEDADALRNLEKFFADRGRSMPPANRVQALIPRGGCALPNSCGTAPGIFMRMKDAAVYVMPGVPSEMRAMFAAHVAPDLAGTGAVLRSETLHCLGLGEAELGERIRDLMQRGRNPEVGTSAQGGIVSIRVNAAAPTTYEAEELLRQAISELRRRLGSIIFGMGDETLSRALGELLVRKNATLAVAESCTGGLLGELITETPGSSRYFLGGVLSYANSAKRDLLGVSAEDLAAHGAVSEPVAAAMASGVRERLHADFGLSITGIAGPAADGTDKPVGLVFVGLATAAGVEVRRYLFGRDSSRSQIRSRAALSAMNWLRLILGDDAA